MNKRIFIQFLMQHKQSKRASHLLILLNLHEATILSVRKRITSFLCKEMFFWSTFTADRDFCDQRLTLKMVQEIDRNNFNNHEMSTRFLLHLNERKPRRFESKTDTHGNAKKSPLHELLTNIKGLKNCNQNNVSTFHKLSRISDFTKWIFMEKKVWNKTILTLFWVDKKCTFWTNEKQKIITQLRNGKRQRWETDFIRC